MEIILKVTRQLFLPDLSFLVSLSLFLFLGSLVAAKSENFA